MSQMQQRTGNGKPKKDPQVQTWYYFSCCTYYPEQVLNRRSIQTGLQRQWQGYIKNCSWICISISKGKQKQ